MFKQTVAIVLIAFAMMLPSSTAQLPQCELLEAAPCVRNYVVAESCEQMELEPNGECVIAGCEETSGAGVGHVDYQGTDYYANGTWINACGGQMNDDQASGNWFGDTATGGWYVSENGRTTSGQRLVTCEISKDPGLYTVGAVVPGVGAASGNCMGGFEGDEFTTSLFTFDLHTPTLD